MHRARFIVLPLLLALVAVAPQAAPVRAASAPYLALEKFTLTLINCTRTGGWVREDGTCKDYGSGKHSKYRKPLRYGPVLSNKVARPWAVKIAAADYCGHSLGGSSITDRFHAAGFHGTHGENVGCGWGEDVKPREVVIRTHRSMQAEKSYNGWHWRNMKDPDFGRVGIGIARDGQEVRVVSDFFQP